MWFRRVLLLAMLVVVGTDSATGGPLQYIYGGLEFQRPFFVAYVCNSLFLLYLVPSCCRRLRRCVPPLCYRSGPLLPVRRPR